MLCTLRTVCGQFSPASGSFQPPPAIRKPHYNAVYRIGTGSFSRFESPWRYFNSHFDQRPITAAPGSKITRPPADRYFPNRRLADHIGRRTLISLYWLPVGAGGYVVRYCSGAWEAIEARRQRRERVPLFHCALIVDDGTHRWVIELAPVWVPGQPADRGVVDEGPVGAAWAGRWRLFRYELRCWADGEIPDAAFAVDSPIVLTEDVNAARALLADVSAVPMHVWGRPVDGGNDMWNSNSVISWLLVRAGISLETVCPPNGGRAPGWQAGIDAADAGPTRRAE